MKPGPRSFRLFSKCVQSTMSRASSVTFHSSAAGGRQRLFPASADRRKRVKFCLTPALAAITVEWVCSAAKAQSQRNCAEFEVAAQRIHEISAVALRQFISAIAKHDEGRWSALHLRNVAQL